MKRKVVLGMAVFMTAIMVPAQAFAAKPTGGGDYLSGTQEAVESGDLDVNEAIATMMEGFEDVYYGTSFFLSRRLLNGRAALEMPYSAVVTGRTVTLSSAYSVCPSSTA